ncbi:MAG: hypothetical protein JSW68_10740 [Burkholderiales bacterium]|nr:MAG: hypothetical protein JSW68_10740 [Burkholderiales bacterium]
MSHDLLSPSRPTRRVAAGGFALGLRYAMLAAALVPLALFALLVLAWLALGGAGVASVDGTWWLLAGAALVIGALAAIGAAVLAARLGDHVAAALDRIGNVMDRVRGGDDASRVGPTIDADEFGRLGHRLDRLLEERVDALAQRARENEQLNNSVIDIMQAVGRIASSKDLGLRVPVTDDVTGAIADALNMLTDETGRVLRNVSAVSQDVAKATIAVKSQSDRAGEAAVREQQEVEAAARGLSQAAETLATIAQRARASNEMAERAVSATGEALDKVSTTVTGVSHSRELIRETEKRIKRLGERSQEIGQVVGIIESIAEKTGILALNASMHAASAGEAGRSFAGVADEVKRLSESAREATSRIGRLVTAIQTETHDTVVAMNDAITQIVQISRMADEAGDAMRLTREQTDALAASVRDIARTSSDQAQVGAALIERARIIQEASRETASQLVAQSVETHRLVEFARALLDEVTVFKLPR